MLEQFFLIPQYVINCTDYIECKSGITTTYLIH